MSYIQATFSLVDLSAVKAAFRSRIKAILENTLARKVIVLINGKGGVGKSSVAVALAFALSAIGYRVLLIEMDEQGNNCEDLGITGTSLDDKGEAQANAILDGTPLLPTGEARPNLFVVPGGDVLESIVEELYVQRRYASYQGSDNDDETDVTEDQVAWMSMYAAAIDAVRDDYDAIILDVAPGSEVLQLQALVAGDMVVIPSKSDPSSRKGLRLVANRFGRARNINAALRLLGVVLFATNTSATKVHERIRETLEADLRGAAPVFNQSIRHVEAAAVACRVQGKLPQEMKELTDVDPSVRKSVASLAGDYQSLGMEILQAWTALNNEVDVA
ncbi:ParA family protein (plasmid) [Nocardia sp. CA-084685]|uniref:ParA family protein n=1 Tax=Nocardia sp. CA-084685 TaxID=3239970 RepID=UPI003D983FFB